jgi:hypothetical protein
MSHIDIKPLLLAIEHYKLMDSWRDGLFTHTKATRNERAQELLTRAQQKYVYMMSSYENDGTEQYEKYAVDRALGLQPRPAHTSIRNKIRRKGLMK